ncbi:hypothetical protein ACFL1H_04305 [Nanoarchaeota archaeon]
MALGIGTSDKCILRFLYDKSNSENQDEFQLEDLMNDIFQVQESCDQKFYHIFENDLLSDSSIYSDLEYLESRGQLKFEDDKVKITEMGKYFASLFSFSKDITNKIEDLYNN